MMLVETDAVIAEAVHFFPGVEMFGIGADRNVGLEVAVGQGVGQLAADLEMLKLFAISEQVEDENFHGRFLLKNGRSSVVEDICREVTARAVVPPIDGKKFHIC